MSIYESINFLFSCVTAICASYLAFAALQHSARPNAKIFLKSPKFFHCGAIETYVFSLKNIGHWYARPMVVNMVVFVNFDSQFEPISIQYGSNQEIEDSNVRIGKGKMKYVKAKGIKLSYGEDSEEVFVKAKNPLIPGKYRIKISAFSENGLSYSKSLEIIVF